MRLEPGQRLGAYEIVGSLGAGGMGEVYRARDTRLGRLVAIKLVSDELAANHAASARLAREASLTSLLNHPNIVTVHDIGASS
jgi:eukaryotic-like serine/threonine-protein kinase